MSSKNVWRSIVISTFLYIYVYETRSILGGIFMILTTKGNKILFKLICKGLWIKRKNCKYLQ